MLSSIIISVLTCVCLMLIILLKPSIKIAKKEFDIYWIVPIVGAILLLCVKSVGIYDIKNAFINNSSTNPLKVLILFFSMSLISIYLDETGFFEYLAFITVKKAKSSQKKLFIIMYFLVAILTVFTSNDIVILTFTPFICKFCKRANVQATPYVMAEFTAANSWSMLLIIGNPTNIYLSAGANIAFANYFFVMLIPTVATGITSLITLFLLFKKKLRKPIEINMEKYELKEKTPAIIGLVFLSLCTLSLAISGYVKVEMWIVSLVFVIALFILVFVYRISCKQKPTVLLNSIKRLPWQLAPTLIGMFIVVLGLVKSGATSYLADFLGNRFLIAKYGVLSTLFANLMNNIPMSVLFNEICAVVPPDFSLMAVYSSIIGSNLGALLTPVGALAGIMFTSILKKNAETFGFKDFIKYGCAITAVCLIFALSGLYLSFLIFR